MFKYPDQRRFFLPRTFFLKTTSVLRQRKQLTLRFFYLINFQKCLEVCMRKYISKVCMRKREEVILLCGYVKQSKSREFTYKQGNTTTTYTSYGDTREQSTFSWTLNVSKRNIEYSRSDEEAYSSALARKQRKLLGCRSKHRGVIQAHGNEVVDSGF